MKVWEKIYIWVLVLFLITFNSCLWFVFNYSYQKNLELEKDVALQQWEIVYDKFYNELEAIHNRGSISDQSIFELYESYVLRYYQKNMGFELVKDGDLLYTSKVGTMNYNSSKEGKISSFYEDDPNYFALLEKRATDYELRSLEFNQEKHIGISTFFSLGDSDYTFVMVKEMYQFKQMWMQMVGIFTFMDMVASLGLALLLGIVLPKLLKPLSELSEAANQMAKGEYKQVLRVKGQDELALLMDSFNKMSIQVEKGIEELRQEAENKQLFIDNFSHELRTPLTIIQGYAQMIQQVKLDEEQRLKYLQYIVSESERMQRMSNELLQLTVLKREAVRYDWFNNETLIKKVTDPLFVMSQEKSIQLAIDFDEFRSYGNEVLIENLMINLINNAMNACEADGIVFVGLYENHLIVKDDGIGMSEECQQHLFEPFYREDKSRSRKSGGVGLGMAICKQIIDYHQGEITVSSAKEEGTIIEVKF